MNDFLKQHGLDVDDCVLDDSTVKAHVDAGRGMGLDRDGLKAHPLFANADEFPDDMLVPEAEWEERLKEQQAKRGTLLDLRKASKGALDSLDQGHYGLCWAFSSTKAAMYTRAIAGEPIIKLSAWWVAGEIKAWRDQGGWGEASLEHIINKGVPRYDLCPSYDRKYDTDACKADAMQHRVTEWWEGSDNADKARHQMISAFLLGFAPVIDLNAMGHSMCGCALADLKPTVVYDNSWGMGNKDGLYVGKGAYARPDGLVIPRVSRPTSA